MPRALGGERRTVHAWAASERSAGEDGEGFAAGEEAGVGEGAAQFDARGDGKRRAAAARAGAFSGKAQRLLDQDGGPSEGADQRQPVKLILLAEGGVAAEEGKAEPVRFLRDEVCKRGDDALASQRENSRRFPVAGGIYGQRTAARGPNVGDPRYIRPVLNGSADVRPKTPKSNRTIKMPEFLCEEMQDYMKQLYRIGKNDRLFEVTKSYLHHEMDRGANAAGVKRIRIHDLRHSHISLLIEMGYSAVAIADRVGHESINITYNYAHLFPSTQSDMADKLNQFRKDGTDNVIKEQGRA